MRCRCLCCVSFCARNAVRSLWKCQSEWQTGHTTQTLRTERRRRCCVSRIRMNWFCILRVRACLSFDIWIGAGSAWKWYRRIEISIWFFVRLRCATIHAVPDLDRLFRTDETPIDVWSRAIDVMVVWLWADRCQCLLFCCFQFFGFKNLSQICKPDYVEQLFSDTRLLSLFLPPFPAHSPIRAPKLDPV